MVRKSFLKVILEFNFEEEKNELVELRKDNILSKGNSAFDWKFLYFSIFSSSHTWNIFFKII